MKLTGRASTLQKSKKVGGLPFVLYLILAAGRPLTAWLTFCVYLSHELPPTWTHPKPTWTHPKPTWTHPKPTWTHPKPTWTQPKPTWTQPKPTWTHSAQADVDSTRGTSGISRNSKQVKSTYDNFKLKQIESQPS